MLREPKPEDYAALGVAADADLEKVRVAYHRRARRLHPDAHPDASPSERARLGAEMAALNEAFDVLEAAARTAPSPRDELEREEPMEFLADEPPGFKVMGLYMGRGAKLRLVGDPRLMPGLAALAGEPVTSIDLAGTEVGNGDLEALRHLTLLRELNLEMTKIGDEGLRAVGTLRELRSLNLGGTPVSDAGLAHLARLQRLQMLTLDDTAVSDAGLPTLAGLRSLHVLTLRRTRVRGPGLVHLADLPELYLLGLSRVGRRHRRGFTALRPDVRLA